MDMFSLICNIMQACGGLYLIYIMTKLWKIIVIYNDKIELMNYRINKIEYHLTKLNKHDLAKFQCSIDEDV